MNSIKSRLGQILCVFTLAAVCYGQITVDHTTVEMLPDNSLTQIIPQTYLDQARQLKVLFCHASVGGTIMTGMVGSSGTTSLIKLNPTRYTVARNQNGPATWFDTNSGIIDISDPSWPLSGSKALGFDNYIRNLGYGQAGRANVAFMKYCYIDWQSGMNVQARWDEYRNTMETLEADFPNITFVWWTTAVANIGNSGPERDQFDNLLRDYCKANNKVLFDLADIECHDPDGNKCYDDYAAEGMWGGYAADGQHPSGYAQTRLATAMWWLLARIAGWQVGPTEIHASASTDILASYALEDATVAARLYDAVNGIYVRNAPVEVTFELTGPGVLYSPTTVTTTDGMASVTYHRGSTTGTATITATAPGLTQDSVDIDLFLNAAPSIPTDPLCNGLIDPQGISDGCAELSWIFHDSDEAIGDSQGAYQVLIADNPANIAANIGNVWDTGKVYSDANSFVLSSVPLRSGIIYYWAVRTWDVSGFVSSYSTPATFTLDFGLGYSAELDPLSGYIDFGNDSSLDLNTDNGFTIEMWVYRTAANVESILVDKLTSTGGYRVVIYASDHVYLRTKGSKDRRAVGTGVKLTKGQWHHVACVRMPTAVSNRGYVYIDGVDAGYNGLISVCNATTAPLRLQQSGIIVDELRISEGARYSSNFTPPAAPFSADGSTKGLWHFDERFGTTAYDSSACANDGVITADANWGAGYFPAPAPPKTPDLNEDGFVDAVDYGMFALQWQCTGPALIADFDDSSTVTAIDLQMLADEWLQPIP